VNLTYNVQRKVQRYKVQRKPNFYSICPCTKDIVLPRFEDFLTFLYIFMNVVKVLCAKNDG